ncbi:hypothetical protein HYH03_011315 [Edaphochlamys debaryana]|uniref:S1 motif domain-containing protein n=1 Tax=Edaphochlamys debaryana TaxID=47281 RepID=A0A835XTX9_9CHLO|nr:hypothetical protein HYH03_011315 [Edaphochlamys debaryana]|eukprot:KAG2490188.1 hypothetical protein HYH03_011315 [Edaphochlamys debaryana]
MLRDPQLVCATAEEMAAKQRLAWQRERERLQEEAAERRRATVAATERRVQARLAAIGSMKEGDLIRGRVHRSSDNCSTGLILSLRDQPKGTRGFIPFSECSHETVEDWESLCHTFRTLKIKIKALVIKPDPDNRRVLLSTKALEPTPGDMMRNPELVYDRAEEMAEACRVKREAAQAAEKEADS